MLPINKKFFLRQWVARHTFKDQRYDIRKIWHSVYALSLKGRRHSSIYFILIIISCQKQTQQISSPGGFLEVVNSHLPPPVIYVLAKAHLVRRGKNSLILCQIISARVKCCKKPTALTAEIVWYLIKKRAHIVRTSGRKLWPRKLTHPRREIGERGIKGLVCIMKPVRVS